MPERDWNFEWIESLNSEFMICDSWIFGIPFSETAVTNCDPEWRLK